MSDSGPPPDWGSIFHRARRRIIGRLLVVAALAASGSALLLGGGLSAQGVSIGSIGNQSDTQTDTAPEKHAKKPRAQKRDPEDKGQSGTPHKHNGKRSEPSKPDEAKKHHDQGTPCARSSAGAQYCDTPEEVDGGEPTAPTDPTVQP